MHKINTRPFSFANIGILFLFSGILIVLSSLATYIFLSSRQNQQPQSSTYQQINSSNSLLQKDKIHSNKFMRYTLKVPKGWIVQENEAYTDPQGVKKIISEMNQQTRGSEISFVMISTYPYLEDYLNCGFGPFEECTHPRFPNGAYLTISVTYTPENTIEKTIARDKSFYKEDTFSISPISIGGRKTYEQRSKECMSKDICSTFIFNAQDHYTYYISLNTYINSPLNQSDKSNLVSTYKKQMDTIISSFNLL